MVKSAVTTPIILAGDGTTTVFPFNFFVLENDHLIVQVILADNSIQLRSEGTHYTIQGVGDENGGTVTFLANHIPATGQSVLLGRVVPPEQPTRLTQNAFIDLPTIERALDRLAMEIDTLKEQNDRTPAFRFASLQDRRGMELPQPNANQVIGYNATGNGLQLFPTTTIGLPTDADAVTYTPAGTGAVATNTEAKLRQFRTVRDFGAVGDGVADDSAAFTAADTAGPFLVTEGIYRLNTSITINSDFFMFDGATIRMDGVATFTSNADITIFPGAIIESIATNTLTAVEASNYRIFGGTGSTVFTGDRIPVVNPKWWGAVGDGNVNDSAAIQAAWDAIKNRSGTIFFPGGFYRCDSALDFRQDAPGTLAF